ncbi:uroporphyrinogen decarboxylase family protein [Megasphaera paucivorans]|uniref:Uroporphyrinogen decarboxylase n=1 Tax=Megasphaera paucivorans TaxID=349095 RepID=A0A1H0BKI0_9FIRM|nr:uroporphyrinogen decarboxylase family protein [Megasphaera paucivorans]SDN46137.1 uroporphyrinogen decarboxylase [Megasphaera paucivorans]
MSQTKKELVLAALDNKPVDRVPVGFWFHILPIPTVHSANAFKNPQLAKLVLAGEEEYLDTAKPDFAKIMTDGFFTYQQDVLSKVKTIDDLKGLQPLPEHDRWFTDQIAYAKKLSNRYSNEILLFYNVFCAATTLKFMLPDGDTSLTTLIQENEEVVKRALDIISDDLAVLSQRIIKEAGITGIYLSLQNIKGLNREAYERILTPGEKKILSAANRASAYNILHICGYLGHRNDLSWYTDYDVKAINWAAHIEEVSLEEGKKLFGGRAVIGGFGNTENDILYNGSKNAVEAETERIIRGAGKTGVILGADCTVPPDISRDRLEWVRQKAAVL